jgi:hypothetical protein
MSKKIRLAALSFSLAAALTFSNSAFSAGQTITKPVTTAKIVKQVEDVNYIELKAMDLVNNPENYLKQNIKISAQFDKFSTIGLDYPPVNKTSKDFISFIIKRPDLVDKEYNIPLSELKFLIKRDKAEKLIDLESGDKVTISGRVISAALGDAWVEVNEVKMLEPKSAKKADKQ